jgi:hypothetical protein
VTIDLGHAEIARSLLAEVPAERATAIADALAKKDGAEVARLAEGLSSREVLVALPTLNGEPALLESLPAVITESPARPAIDELRVLVRKLSVLLGMEGLTIAKLSVDLGEVRGLALDVDALLWALRLANASVLERPRRVVVCGDRAETFARALRTSGVPAAIVTEDPYGYAKTWGYAWVARVSEEGVVVTDPEGRPTELTTTEAAIQRLSMY